MKDFLSHYNAFFEKVYRYIFFRVGKNRELAEDLTSEIFLKAFENFESFDGVRPFAVWIYRIAHNHLVDYYKKVKAEIVPIEDAENDLKVNVDYQYDFDKEIDLEKVKGLLEKLPQVQMDVVIMKYVNDLTNPEIAQILKTNEAHVRVLQHRALSALRSNLAFI